MENNQHLFVVLFLADWESLPLPFYTSGSNDCLSYVHTVTLKGKYQPLYLTFHGPINCTNFVFFVMEQLLVRMEIWTTE